MKPKVIDTAEEYDNALIRVSELMTAKAGTADFEELRVWAVLVEQYEAVHFPISQPDPIMFVRQQIERLQMSQNEFARNARIQSSHLSAVLNGKRPLSKTQANAIAEFLNVDVALMGFSSQHHAA